MPLMRLDKLIASQTGFSRRQVHQLLGRGAVLVDGAAARQPDRKVDPALSAVTVEGKPLEYRAHCYLLLNKPLGYVCTTGEKDGPNVLQLVPGQWRSRALFPAGRLDKYSEGMVLLTDDGDFAHRILAPRRHVEKLYYVQLDRPIPPGAAQAFAAGMALDGGERCRPALLQPDGECAAYVTLREGLYHQIRRMFQLQGCRVTRLVRLAMGGLAMPATLPQGECLLLGEEQLRQLEEGTLAGLPPPV